MAGSRICSLQSRLQFTVTWIRGANAPLIRGTAVVLFLYVGLVSLNGPAVRKDADGLYPEQDQGFLITVVQLTAGSEPSIGRRP